MLILGKHGLISHVIFVLVCMMSEAASHITRISMCSTSLDSDKFSVLVLVGISNGSAQALTEPCNH